MITGIRNKLKGYRTVAFNTIVGLPVLVDAIAPVLIDPDVGQLIPEDWYPVYLKVVVIVNLWLRYVTTTPVGVK